MWKKWFGKQYDEAEEHSVIGSGLQIQGPIRGMGELEIRGRVEGEIVHSGRLIIAAGAVCLGSIQTDEVELAGEVHGNIHARDRLELMPSARLYGDTFCSSLQIHPGAVFQGTNRMSEGLLPAPRRAAALPAPATSALAILCEPIGANEPPLEQMLEEEPAALEQMDEPPPQESVKPVHLPLEIPAFQGGFGPVPAARKIG